jgi:TonB family protein
MRPQILALLALAACASSPEDYVPGVSARVAFRVTPSGALTQAYVLDDSSESRTLGASCLLALREAGPFEPPPPLILGKPVYMTCKLSDDTE